MDLYIVNSMNKHLLFMYRDPENPRKSYTKPIPMAGQELIERGISMERAHKIIEQWDHYGLISLAEASMQRNYVGVCYRFDEPAKSAEIEDVLEQNKAALKVKGEQMMEDMFGVVNDQITKAVGRPPDVLAVETVEESDNPKIAQGFIKAVSEDALAAARERRARREFTRKTPAA
jgi:hypothetical protein